MVGLAVDAHDVALLDVKSHTPLFCPYLKLLYVFLECEMVFHAGYGTIQQAVSGKKTASDIVLFHLV